MSITQRGTPLYAADGAAGDQFGQSSAISATGTVLAVGAPLRVSSALPECGGVYVYDWSGSAWTARGSVLTAPTPVDYSHYGYSIALSDDGLVLAVGAPAEAHGAYVGIVYVYDWSGSAWVLRGTVTENTASHDQYGQVIALSGNGLVLAVGDYWTSGFYIYDWSGSAWVPRGSLLTSPSSYNIGGDSVALSYDGAILAAGVTTYTYGGITARGAVVLYDYAASVWTERATLVLATDAASNDFLGTSIALNSDGTSLIAGAYGWSSTTGKAYRFTYAAGAWTQADTFFPSDAAASDQFGFGVALSSNGLVAMVGATGWEGTATNMGAVYTFDATSAIELSGHALSVATAAGTLSGPVNISGAAVSLATAAGMLSGPAKLSGAAVSLATGYGSLLAGKFEYIIDAIAAADSPVLTMSNTQSEAAGCADSLALRYGPINSDSAAVSDTLAPVVFTIYVESIGLSDSLSQHANTTASLIDSARMADLIQHAINQLIADSAAGADSLSLGAALTLVDIANAVQTQASTYNSVMLVAELIATLESYNSVASEDMAESGVLTDAYVARVSALVALLEAAQAVDTDTAVVYVMQAVADTAAGATSITSAGSLLTTLLNDAVLATIRLNIGGELFTGWVLNTETLAPSEYQFADLQFNSACKHGDTYLMAADDGIYQFTQDTGIETVMTYIKTGKTDFGSDMRKGVVDAYMVYSATGQMALKVTTSENGVLQTNNYTMTPFAATDTPDPQRVDIGKGLKSRYWQFELTGANAGCKFDEIGMLPVVLSRRI